MLSKTRLQGVRQFSNKNEIKVLAIFESPNHDQVVMLKSWASSKTP